MKLHDVLIPASIGLGLLSPMAAHAGVSDLSLTFNPATLSAVLGSVTTLTFQGTLTDTSATNNIFLNGDQLLLVAPGTATDDTDYFSNIPYDSSVGVDGGYNYLTPGQSVTINLFTVALNGTTPLGTYTGSFGVTGGEGEANKNSNTLLTSSPFAVTIQKPASVPVTGFVPETSPVALLGLGLLPLGLLAVRRRRA